MKKINWGNGKNFRAVWPLVGWSSARSDYSGHTAMSQVVSRVVQRVFTKREKMDLSCTFSHIVTKHFQLPKYINSFNRFALRSVKAVNHARKRFILDVSLSRRRRMNLVRSVNSRCSFIQLKTYKSSKKRLSVLAAHRPVLFLRAKRRKSNHILIGSLRWRKLPSRGKKTFFLHEKEQSKLKIRTTSLTRRKRKRKNIRRIRRRLLRLSDKAIKFRRGKALRVRKEKFTQTSKQRVVIFCQLFLKSVHYKIVKELTRTVKNKPSARRRYDYRTPYQKRVASLRRRLAMKQKSLRLRRLRIIMLRNGRLIFTKNTKGLKKKPTLKMEEGMSVDVKNSVFNKKVLNYATVIDNCSTIYSFNSKNSKLVHLARALMNRAARSVSGLEEVVNISFASKFMILRAAVKKQRLAYRRVERRAKRLLKKNKPRRKPSVGKTFTNPKKRYMRKVKNKRRSNPRQKKITDSISSRNKFFMTNRNCLLRLSSLRRHIKIASLGRRWTFVLSSQRKVRYISGMQNFTANDVPFLSPVRSVRKSSLAVPGVKVKVSLQRRLRSMKTTTNFVSRRLHRSSAKKLRKSRTLKLYKKKKTKAGSASKKKIAISQG